MACISRGCDTSQYGGLVAPIGCRGCNVCMGLLATGQADWLADTTGF